MRQFLNVEFAKLVEGILDLTLTGKLVALALMTHVSIIAITIFLHRSQAHRAVDLHPIVSHFFRFWLWISSGTVTREWVAVHRKHHAACETTEDPHSPQNRGIRTVLLRGAELYQDAASNETMLERYGRGTPDDWIERNLYTGRRNLGIVLMLVIDLTLFGALGLTIWAVQMAWMPILAAGVINGLGHWWGYRNQETADASTNLVPWGILIGGEELHNNHHAAPTSARLSARWFEFDIGWFYIRLFSLLGLATVRFDAFTKPKRTRSVQFDRRFVRQVVLPMLHTARREAAHTDRSLFRQGRWLMARKRAQLDAWQHQRLERLLALSSPLETVYQFRQQLVELWQRTAEDVDTFRHEFADWCTRAEQSGITALREFAESLRGQELLPAPAR